MIFGIGNSLNEFKKFLIFGADGFSEDLVFGEQGLRKSCGFRELNGPSFDLVFEGFVIFL